MLLCILFISSYADGTTILAVFRGGNIWIAADSKLTIAAGAKPRYVCKIVNAGKFYWAAASMIYEDPVTGFTVPLLVDDIKSTPGTIREAMNAFIATSKLPIRQELSFMKRTNPAKFAQFFSKANGKPHWIRIVFVGVEKGHPRATWTDITTEIIGGQVFVDGTAVEPREAAGTLGLGVNTDAHNYIAEHHSQIATDPAGVVRRAMIAANEGRPRARWGKD